MSIAYLVTLIRKVIVELKIFMFFYFILVFMFALILGVLGFQNYTRMERIDPERYTALVSSEEWPGFEYSHINNFLAYIFTVMRMSLGDNDFGAVFYLDDLTGPEDLWTRPKGQIFWLIWLLIAYITFIIFMNFIITEAGEIYGAVDENL